MAKADFCFTYYDGDAARDKAHMNRLERGGYDDLLVSQRKFGHLSLALIKKTLGFDFDQVWEAIQIVLKTDAEGKFFIEWLENSVQRMSRQSVKQSANGKKGGRPKANRKPNTNPTESQTESQEKPLGNGYGYGIEDVIEILNRTIGASFKKTAKKNSDPISARMNEGYTLEDFETVIRHKWQTWGTDPKMKEYLRPETLFGPKFDGYLQAAKIRPLSKIDGILDVSARQDEEIKAKYR